jgi:hypothetical protein
MLVWQILNFYMNVVSKNVFVEISLKLTFVYVDVFMLFKQK